MIHGWLCSLVMFSTAVGYFALGLLVRTPPRTMEMQAKCPCCQKHLKIIWSNTQKKVIYTGADKQTEDRLTRNE